MTPNQEREKQRRELLTLWAYAYEIMSDSLVPDEVYDREAKKSEKYLPTDNPVLDEWWFNNFDHNTGMWIHNHPALEKIAERYKRLKHNQWSKQEKDLSSTGDNNVQS